MSRYFLDSDIIIALLRGNKETTALIKELESESSIPATSPICIAEVQAGVKPGEEERTNILLNSLLTYNLDRELANKAGEYIREYRKKGITLLLSDTLIAATCIANDLELVTYNVRHYPMPEIKLKR